MSKYDYVFFDLDGTISDSALGIVNSVIYALDKMGIEQPNRELLKRFVGPPLQESFTMYLGLSQPDANAAIKHFRHYYSEKGILENSMYDGIENLIVELKHSGKTLVVATSKPEPFARDILRRYGIDEAFAYIAGSTLDETRTKKDEVITYALETMAISDTSRVVMVGDRFHDVVGAAKNGIDCIGVLYGYGSREELESAGAAYIASNTDEVARIVLEQ